MSPSAASNEDHRLEGGVSLIEPQFLGLAEGAVDGECRAKNGREQGRRPQKVKASYLEEGGETVAEITAFSVFASPGVVT